jgi:hypothetical protein
MRALAAAGAGTADANGMRSMFLPLLAIALVIGASNTATATENPEPAACARAYAIAHDFRAAVRGMEAKPEANGAHRLFGGLSPYIDGFATIDFDARADALGKKFPEKFDSTTGVFGVKLSASGVAQDLLLESTNGSLAALVSPDKVFPEQRKIFGLARSCDLAHGFKPALGEAPAPDRVVAILRAKTEKQVEEKNKQLAALDDTECAIRFTLAGNMFPPDSDGQQGMMQRLQVAASKAIAGQAGLTQERLMTLIQRGMTERAEKLKSGSYNAETLIEEVRACETRLGLPSSGLKLNAS